jgi:hypothetical protein
MQLRRHYASSRYVRYSLVGSLLVGVLAYAVVPDEALAVTAAVLKIGWFVLGAIAALCVQLAMRLMTLGEDRQLDGREQERLADLVDQRLRYLYDLSIVAVVGIGLGVAAGEVGAQSENLRILVASALAMGVWATLLAMRLLMLIKEIRAFLWRLAQDRRQSEVRESTLKRLRHGEEQDLPEIPEPLHRNGTEH